tara:strand:+ start:63 stop:251 length:189 start_codon:yes stop_codon:yes gene_type:complete
MKKILLLSLLISGCNQYQVVQEVRVNMYHLHSPTKGVEVIVTKDSLTIGEWYNIKRLNIIEL